MAEPERRDPPAPKSGVDSEDAFAPTMDGSAEIGLAATIDSPSVPAAATATVKRGLTIEQPLRYERREEIGRGGIGRVMLVFDTHLGREIALKELLAQASPTGDGAVSIGVAARFLREARITGQLEHPGIVPVYELGQREDGSLYYTMRRIRGRSLARSLAGASALEERLKLLGYFRKVCEAVAYAHSHGVVHRDLKPDNVMVGEFGETLVVDWGLAKVRGESDPRARDIEQRVSLIIASEGAATVDGHVIGTPAYMSPEQARGDLEAIDERSDVWGLGAMLFEILTGKPPHGGEHAMEILRHVLEERAPRVLELSPRAPPELAAIADRALLRDPSSRYPDASQLASEIAAFQDGQRVHAYEYSSLERIKRFVRKNRAASIAAAIVLAAVVGSSVFSYRSYRSEAGAREIAEHRRADAVAQRERALERAAAAQVALAEVLLERAERALDDGDPAAAAIYAAGALVRDPTRADHARERADGAHARERWARALSAYVAAEDARRFVFVRRIDGAGMGGGISPDGSILVFPHGADLAIEELATRERRVLRGLAGTVLAVLDRDRAIVAGRRPGVIALADGRLLHALPESTTGAAVGTGRYAICTIDGAITVFDSATHAEQGRIPALAAGDLPMAWAGDSLAAIAPSKDEILRWRWPAHGEPDRRALTSPAFAIAASPNGAQIAVGMADPELTLLASATLELERTIASRGWTTDVTWLSDDLLASAENASIVVRDVAERQKLETLHLPPNHGLQLVSPRSGRALISLPYRDGTHPVEASLFRWERQRTESARSLGESVRVALEDPPRQRVIAATLHGIHALPIVRDLLGPPALIGAVPNEYGHPIMIAIAADGAVATITSTGAVLLYELGASEGTLLFPSSGQTLRAGLVFDPTGDVLYAGERRGAILRWRRSRSAPMMPLAGHTGEVCSLSMRADGARLVSAARDGAVRIWDVRQNRTISTVQLRESQPSDVAFDPRGGRFALADDLGWVSLRDENDGHELARFRASQDWVNRVAWSPNGGLLATASDDRAIRIFADDGARLLRVLRVEGVPLAVHFGAGGDHLVVHDVGEVIRVRVDTPFDRLEPEELLRRAEVRAGVRLDGLDLVTE